MEGLTPREIEHLSTLSRINLSESERQEFAKQLPGIVAFVETLRQIATPNTERREPASLNDCRMDEPTTRGLSIEQLERLAPRFSGRSVEVPAVFEEECE